jgi:hypothetical protein
MLTYGASSVARRARKAVPEGPLLCTEVPSGATELPPNGAKKGLMSATSAHAVTPIVRVP